jgi:N-acetylmuramoyl-L-alanine amidase
VTLQRVWLPSPNYSSRSTSVRLIVLHTTEGARTYQDLGNYFANRATQVSSHVGIDDTPGVIGEYVKRGNKAWTQGNANSYSVAAEQCAFAAWSASEWAKHPQMLANTAAWVAEEAAYFGIPIVALTSAQAQDGRSKGVCQHVNLGAAGGGHTDCGSSYPMAQVIEMAKGGTPAPEPVPPVMKFGGQVFAKQKDGSLLWFIANGAQSYWRPVPPGQAKDVPDSMIINDPNGSWAALWRIGAPAGA